MSRPRRVIAAVLLVFALAFTTAAPASAFTVEQAQAFFLTRSAHPTTRSTSSTMLCSAATRTSGPGRCTASGSGRPAAPWSGWRG